MKTATNAPLGKDAIALAGLFLTSGTMHFVKPEPFEAMVPRQLPSRRALVYASGALEIACAVGLFIPHTRRAAGLASAALLVAVFPANVTMTGQAKRRLDRDPDDPKKQGYLAATVARLPLQWPMIRAALRAGGVVR
ncbi:MULTISPECIES: MauE/DoxX family redox-associated membrane protein [unclassified Terrabacter]|uniref:DoxX family protein n=1 Tax=unclassified Terrabacter TaxID=2630222 RepID=UPI0006F9511C|nr:MULTISPECIES: MauE/DoxX family redox-associated membrane protein [unclassified Terrabacter]KRB48292.1 DoxX family protein [Terrabacter sp. Root181]KRF40797.1 DoxX family protein [Terrabacter sp. Soil810]